MIPPHFLAKLETQKYYENEPNFNNVYSRNNFPIISDEACVINLEEYQLIRTHQIALYLDDDNARHFDSFWVKHIPKKI